MKRMLSLLLVLGCLLPAAAFGFTVSVNQFVEHPALDAVLKGFQDQMKDDGVSVDYNVHIAQANMATTVQIANQILGEKPDLVLAIATPSAQACAQKINNIPILFTAVTDPVGAGLVKSLNEPGANVTGMTDLSPVARQVALIWEFQPDLKTIGVIYNAGEANSVTLVNLLKDVCKKNGIGVEEATVLNSSGVYQAAKSLVGRCDAVYIPTDNTVISALESAVKICDESNLPLYCADTDSVDRGAIAALAVDYYRMGRQTAQMAQRIQKEGAKVSTMPVEDLQDLKLYVNPKAADAMGVNVPDSVLARADKIVQ